MTLSVLERIRAFYRTTFGVEGQVHAQPLTPSGSKRQYFRVQGSAGTVIATFSDNLAETQDFVRLARHFRDKGLRVPQLIALSEDQTLYLQEDLGDVHLYHLLPQPVASFSEDLVQWYEKALETLAAIQVKGAENLGPWPSFDQAAMERDVQYFKYYFVKLLEIPFVEEELDAELQSLVTWLSEVPREGFMVRDFQSRNILLSQGQTHVIDFQGGKIGPYQYDVVSLLWQAKAQVPFTRKLLLLDHYLGALEALTPVDKDAFKAAYYGFVLLRSLQVLGAYGFRGIVQRKPHFLQSIPYAVANIRWLFAEGVLPKPFPYLQDRIFGVLEEYLDLNQFAMISGVDKPLTVRIRSFSFKQGYPEDPSGNGGGYVFDCRALHNPGRYEPYKKLTGRDESVQQFLMTNSEMPTFLQEVYEIVGHSVQNYLERDFASLMVSFGCTGGQHRSVFAADQLAAYLEKTYQVKTEVLHIEQERKGWIN
ncbi:MAG: RNase adapter RapZ [Bacteroidota bacterium]